MHFFRCIVCVPFLPRLALKVRRRSAEMRHAEMKIDPEREEGEREKKKLRREGARARASLAALNKEET